MGWAVGIGMAVTGMRHRDGGHRCNPQSAGNDSVQHGRHRSMEREGIQNGEAPLSIIVELALPLI
jgi:hypothetical protein